MLNFKTALVKKSELIEDEESELFGYEFARTLEIRNDVFLNYRMYYYILPLPSSI